MLLAHGAAFALVALGLTAGFAAVVAILSLESPRALMIQQVTFPLALLMASQVPRPLSNAAINGAIEPGYALRERMPTVRKLRQEGVELSGVMTRGAAGGIDSYLPVTLATFAHWRLSQSAFGDNPGLILWALLLNGALIALALWRLRRYTPGHGGHAMAVLVAYVGVLVLSTEGALLIVRGALAAPVPLPPALLSLDQVWIVGALALLACLRPALIAGYFVALDGSVDRLRRRIKREQGLTEEVFD